MKVVLEALPYLLQAAGTTLWVSLLGMALGQVLGAAVCLLRQSGVPGLDGAGAVYVSFFRGVPLLVQLLLIYYLLPVIGINVPAIVAAIAGLGLASAAYQAEILRGALNTVSSGSREAALALGFSAIDTWRRILLPQALRIAMPPLISEFILLLKASSLISVVGVADLTRVSMNIASSTYRPLEAYVAAGAIYLVINLCLAGFGAVAERRLAVG